MPKISVIIPAYKVQSCLKRAVDSVLAQTCQDFEILIVDDASPDETLALATALAQKDTRIRVFSQTPNQGPSAARNRGFSEARGDWLAVLDADDAFHPWRLQELLNLAEESHADIVVDDLHFYDVGRDKLLHTAFAWAKKRKMTDIEFLSTEWTWRESSLQTMKPMWNAAFMRKNGIQYPTQYRYGEDFFILAEAFIFGAVTYVLPRAGYIYTTGVGLLSGQANTASATKRDPAQIRDMLTDLLARHAGRLSPRQLTALRKREVAWLARLASNDIGQLVRQKRFIELLRLVVRHPLSICYKVAARLSCWRARRYAD